MNLVPNFQKLDGYLKQHHHKGHCNNSKKSSLKSVYLIATRDLSNLWLQFFLSQNQGFMRLFEKTVLK